MVCDASLLMQTFFQTINTTRTPTVVKKWITKVGKLELNSAVFYLGNTVFPDPINRGILFEFSEKLLVFNAFDILFCLRLYRTKEAIRSIVELIMIIR